MSTGSVRVETGGGIVRITLDRPPLNVLDRDMLEELTEALGAAAAREVKAVLLTGAGRAFCAGVDVADHTADRVDGMIAAFGAAINALLEVEAPVIGAVNGAALGGGCELILACDMVLAREDAKLGQPEIRLGVFPPAAAVLLPRVVGRQRALDLILTGRTICATEAVPLGLVQRAIPGEEFEAAVGSYLAQLTRLSAPVLRLAKRAVRGGLEEPLRCALHAADRIYLDDLMQLHDSHEGLAAFMEKREPVWSDA